MKRNFRFLLLFTISLLSTVAFGQVGISTQTPHEQAILDVHETNKGIIFPMVTDSTNLPHFNDDKSHSENTGLTFYDQQSKSLRYYDGNSWNELSNLTGAKTKALIPSEINASSAVKTKRGEFIACLVVTCTPVKEIKFNKYGEGYPDRIESNVAYDPSYIMEGSKKAVIKKDGFYEINASVGIEIPIAISLGNTFFQVDLKVNGNKVGQTLPRYNVFSIANTTVGRVSKTAYLKAGDKITVGVGMNFNVSLGAYYVSDSPKKTYLEVTYIGDQYRDEIP